MMRIVWAAIAGLVGLLFAVGAALQFIGQEAERITKCTVGGAILAPVNIVAGTVNLTDGAVDGLLNFGGDQIDRALSALGFGEDGPLDKYSEEQLEIGAQAVGVGLSRNESARLIQAMLMGGMYESSLINRPDGDGDRLGWLQMSASDTWGSPEELLDPVYVANAFLLRGRTLLTQEQIDTMPLWQITATVLHGDMTGGEKYDAWQEDASIMYEAFAEIGRGSVVVIGDEHTLGMSYSAENYLRLSGWTSTVIDAADGRRIVESLDNGTISGVAAVERYLAADQRPVVWIVDLGINDVAAIDSVEAALELINALLERMPEETPVAWVTVHAPGEAGAAFFNEALKQFADNPYVGIIEWDAYASQTPGLLLDGRSELTYSSRGYDQRASIVTEAAIEPSVYFDFFGDDEPLGFKIPSACEFGSDVVERALAVISGEVGNPSDSENTLFDWVFEDEGYDFEELLKNGDRLDSFNEAQIGDLVLWADNPNNPDAVTRTGIYLGGGMAIIEPEPGEVTTISRMEWGTVKEIVRIEIDVVGSGRAIGDAVPVLGREGTTRVREFTVNPLIASDLEALLQAAEADGIILGGWGWRDGQDQIRLRRQNCGPSEFAIYQMPSSQCRPPTARPGSSMHERGLALDFTCGRGENAVSIGTRQSPCYQWLAANASRFGLFNLPSEPWHWSTNGR